MTTLRLSWVLHRHYRRGRSASVLSLSRYCCCSRSCDFLSINDRCHQRWDAGIKGLQSDTVQREWIGVSALPVDPAIIGFISATSGRIRTVALLPDSTVTVHTPDRYRIGTNRTTGYPARLAHCPVRHRTGSDCRIRMMCAVGSVFARTSRHGRVILVLLLEVLLMAGLVVPHSSSRSNGQSPCPSQRSPMYGSKRRRMCSQPVTTTTTTTTTTPNTTGTAAGAAAADGGTATATTATTTPTTLTTNNVGVPMEVDGC